jgi:hypothetical protein
LEIHKYRYHHGFLEIIDAFGNVVDGETTVLTNGLVLQFIIAIFVFAGAM